MMMTHAPIDKSLRRIGWIGTGLMGLPMAMHLQQAGCDLAVFTRSKARAQPLLDAGATWADSPAAAAEGRAVVFSIVGYPDDVEQTHLGCDGTLHAATLPGIIVDMTTSTPTLAGRIAEYAAARGVGSIDAPVSGGDVGARAATLSIMVGGEAADITRIMPLLQCMGSNIVHQGGHGAGQHTKMVNQILIAGNMMGVCEGMLYAARAGLDPAKVIASVGSGAAGSWAINNLGPRMIARDFKPGFYVEHFIKDLSIALDEAQRLNLAMPALALARQLFEAVRGQGMAREGTQALLLALERLSGVAR